MIELIVSLLLLLGLSKIAGELFERFGYSAVAGEILVGVMLGPSLLGWVSPDVTLTTMADVSVFFFVMLTGLELRLSEIRGGFRRVLLISWASLLFPFGIGFILTSHLGWTLSQSLVVSLALSLTALPVIVRILMETGLLATRVGTILVGVALVSDVLAVSALSIVLQIGTGGVPSPVDMLILTAKIIVFISLIFSIERAVANATRIRPGYLPAMFERLLRSVRTSEGLFAITILTVMVFASLSELIGLHFIVGTFFGGLLICREILGRKHFRRVVRTTRSITMAFFAPIFFAFVGVMLDLHAGIPLLAVGAVLLSALLGKFLAGTIGGRLAGVTDREIRILSIGLTSYGLLDLVIVTVAFDLHVITMEQFTSIVVLVLVSILTVPALLRRLSRGIPGHDTRPPPTAPEGRVRVLRSRTRPPRKRG